MDVATTLSAVQTLFAALGCGELKEFCSKFGYKSKLNQLEATVLRIQAVFKDAELKQQLSQQQKHFLEELKEAVYEADDLLDEFVTLAKQKKLNKGIKSRISSLFSEFGHAFSMSQKVDNIRKKLDEIAEDHSKFKFKTDLMPNKKISRETCSYANDVIIGREHDLETIKGMLLHSDVQPHISFLSIVGIGGLGKTALAQLLFHDQEVSNAFPSKYWACVSDQDQNQFDVKQILCKILETADKEQHHGASLEVVQRQIREILGGHKFLIVLDDVWTEDRKLWSDLVGCFFGGASGSWIVVTTRSKKTGKIIGDDRMHVLEGLSKEDSLRLFRRTAFGSEDYSPPQHLVKIGEEIVERCAYVPLAIRVVGSLLYGQEEGEWVSFQELGLAKIKESENSIMPILKLSYEQLESPLKSCFGYCALFPKDHKILRMELIRLWMAQGLVTVEDGKCMEDVAKYYVNILIQRCLFQDVELHNDTDNIYSFKMHDLMHDVAQEVAGEEIRIVHNMNGDMDTKVRHLSFIRSNSAKFSFTDKARVRSFVCVSPHFDYVNLQMDDVSVAALLGNWKYLRALDLRGLQIGSLPSSIGQLLHLRYLNLSLNKIKVLPRTITKLYNLQILGLAFCKLLKELPKDIGKLVQLRVLDIYGCYGLTYMPRGMGKLTSLQELRMFVVGDAKSSSRKELLDGLEDLKLLSNLRGELDIKIQFSNKGSGKEGVGECLRDKERLENVSIVFGKEEGEGRAMYDEAVMDKLQPHPNLKKLLISGYHGVSMVGWAREHKLATSLPNLVSVTITECPELRDIRCLGNLCHLKCLSLTKLPNVEYIIGKVDILPFYPSLEELRLRDLPKLKGWVRDSEELHGNSNSMSMTPLLFSALKTLKISNCLELTTIVQFPQLKELSLNGFNKRLQIKGQETSNSSASSSPCHSFGNLTKIKIDDMAWLHQSLPNKTFQRLESLEIRGDKEVESLEKVREIFQSWSSSLRSLDIEKCCNVKSVSGGLDYLTALESLRISNCPNLSLSEDDGRGMPWQSLHHSLRYLSLYHIPQLVNVPNWIQYLNSLQILRITKCQQLESLPCWMSKLTSLRELEIRGCSSLLYQRCQRSSGEYWPHIQHIPSIYIK